MGKVDPYSPRNLEREMLCIQPTQLNEFMKAVTKLVVLVAGLGVFALASCCDGGGQPSPAPALIEVPQK